MLGTEPERKKLFSERLRRPNQSLFENHLLKNASEKGVYNIRC